MCIKKLFDKFNISINTKRGNTNKIKNGDNNQIGNNITNNYLSDINENYDYEIKAYKDKKEIASFFCDIDTSDVEKGEYGIYSNDKVTKFLNSHHKDYSVNKTLNIKIFKGDNLVIDIQPKNVVVNSSHGNGTIYIWDKEKYDKWENNKNNPSE